MYKALSCFTEGNSLGIASFSIDRMGHENHLIVSLNLGSSFRIFILNNKPTTSANRRRSFNVDRKTNISDDDSPF